ncbi:hypothetical protein KI387_010076 [Taxus chinensis]|uniref:NB-ARC domain-containing protein n=1 Tax=Taxus chinensis TaxID=29808 RepID=A0AA38FK75_TAXCH|nr:hypothetical protein KI387_010076 [Taxus chinensis]
MGGAGKTTLAKDLYNKNCSSFLNSSFIFDVRDADSRKLLHEKQKKLLKDLGVQNKDLWFDNIEEGKGILASRLRSVSALIVLNDVDHEDQLDALLPTMNHLGSGSFIIITSRELGVLRKWGISSIYRMKSLNRFYAKQLFCWHAFLQSYPLQGFEDLVEEFLNVCSGLPLSLKVFGGQVYGKSKGYWECGVNSLPKEFCALESLEHLKLTAGRMSSLPTSFGDLTNLRHIDFSHCGILKMLPVSFKQLIHLQHLDLSWCENLRLRPDMMENMTKLEYLNFSLCSNLEMLPHHITNQASLRKLYADHTRLKNIPTNVGVLCKLEVLEIGSPLLETLPPSLDNLSSLSRLKIYGCNMLKSLSISVGRLNMLKYLSIQSSAIESLPEDFGQLFNLQRLNIEYCPLRQLGSTSSLCRFKVIDIRGTEVSSISISEDSCPTLETLSLYDNNCLPHIKTLPTSVKTIELSRCGMLKRIGAILGLVNLQSLSISDCRQLDVLPSFRSLTSLKEISIQDCYKIDKIEGLEQSRSLGRLTAWTLGKSGGIQSLEQAERLKSVTVVAESRSALQPCIQSIKVRMNERSHFSNFCKNFLDQVAVAQVNPFHSVPAEAGRDFPGMKIILRVSLDKVMNPFVFVAYTLAVATFAMAPVAYCLERVPPETWVSFEGCAGRVEKSQCHE